MQRLYQAFFKPEEEFQRSDKDLVVAAEQSGGVV
jgi:hypothetical protein